MKKLLAGISMLLTTLAFAATVFAAGACTGKVTKVEGDKVTVTLRENSFFTVDVTRCLQTAAAWGLFHSSPTTAILPEGDTCHA